MFPIEIFSITSQGQNLIDVPGHIHDGVLFARQAGLEIYVHPILRQGRFRSTLMAVATNISVRQGFNPAYLKEIDPDGRQFQDQ